MHGWEGETNYVFRTNWQLSKPSIEVVHGNLVAVFSSRDAYLFLIIFMFCCVLGLNG